MPTLAVFKLLVFVCATVFFFYAFASLLLPKNDENNNDSMLLKYKSLEFAIQSSRTKVLPNLVHEDIKYILLWTSLLPFMRQGRSTFIENNCDYTNCIVTDDRDFFINANDIDVVIFNGEDLRHKEAYELPNVRSPNQKYIFAMMDSAVNWPICDQHFNGYFNWTWTYRLDSTVRWNYFTVYDFNDNVVAPKAAIKWLTRFEPINDELKDRLKNKSKVAARFLSTCKNSDSAIFAQKVSEELKSFNESVNIYGTCKDLKRCTRNEVHCQQMLENEYYFYFSFEDSSDKDYVTEEVLTAFNNFAVPVVFGGANYSRFLPPGSYLDAKKLGVKNLAKTMKEIMNNATMYEDFFRWRNHYYVKETLTDVCDLCAVLNNKHEFNRKSVIKNFTEWWNKDNVCV